MQLIHEVTALRAAIAQRRAQGQRIALVPTMGNLHAGHASLVAQARDSADCVVVSIFVNPLQFGPNEDFDRYPRTLGADCEVLREQGATLVFAPSLEQMYSNGYPPSTTVQVDGTLVEQLDGVSRPGHFRGVATVVNILFNLVQPDLAIFGEKDYQQLAVIRRMAADLGLPIEVRGAPTVREADGLARSSRNQYLSAEQRARSSTIFASLQHVASRLRSGRRDFAALEREAAEMLVERGFQPDYVAIRASDLAPPTVDADGYVVLIAALLGSTRLIDNLSVNLQPRHE